jgi:hypothetical protein
MIALNESVPRLLGKDKTREVVETEREGYVASCLLLLCCFVVLLSFALLCALFVFSLASIICLVPERLAPEQVFVFRFLSRVNFFSRQEAGATSIFLHRLRQGSIIISIRILYYI